MTDPQPAAEGVASGHFPGPPLEKGHVAPCPRRIRARIDGEWVLDTTAAYYVWEHPYYPQYAVPSANLPQSMLDRARRTPDDPRLEGYAIVHFQTEEAWFEEDEEVLGHPRSPYVRVDAVRSTRTITVTVPGEGEEPDRLLARTSSPVAVFETGLPPRWYLDPTCIDFSLLEPADTVTLCPYKGRTTGYWNLRDGPDDVAWSYGAPGRGLGPITGLVCFDDTLVHVEVEPDDGR